MDIEFAKLHGLGNDFVFIDGLAQTIELNTEQVAYLCDRHFGIGADGVIVVKPSPRENCAAYMHYINADGSLAQMCGNGVRCFAKFLVDRRYVNPADGHLVADTLSGPHDIDFVVDEQGIMLEACVDMGLPILDPKQVPVSVPANSQSPSGSAFVGETPLDSPWGTFAFTCVSMGNPHAICFVDDFSQLSDQLFCDPTNKCLATLDVNMIGAYFETHPVFPEKTNVEFACLSDKGIHMRVYERGCAETLACGTGACATNTAAYLTGRSGKENDLFLRGGTLHIRLCDDGHVQMRGSATQSFTGHITL